MTPERWKQTEELFHAARSRPAGARAAFLAEACRDDEALRREVESLLNEAVSGDGFLAEPALVGAAQMVAELAPAALAGRPLGGYQLQRLLGAGGMGEVYLARDPKLGRDVAIKILPRAFTSHADRLARFEREARMLAALNHPNICAIYGLEEADGLRFLILELVEGETLADTLAAVARPESQGSGLPLGEALTIARQIAEALEVAHEKGIVHRDLKPANIKVTPDGVVKVLDFGLAKAVGGDGATPELTDAPMVTGSGRREGAVMGTAAYMSPEQARGLTVDKRTDIWAFGCVLYEMLTGRVTFMGDTVSDTIAKILEREPDWSALPAATPAPIRRLLLRCLAKDPRQRLRDIGDVRIEVDAVDEVVPGAFEEVVPPARTRTRPMWLPWVVAGGVTFGLALVLTLWAPWRSVPPLAPVRLSVDLSSDVSVTNSIGTQYGGSTILSPDGTVVAFVAQKGAAGTPQLYVRRLNQLQATPLSGTAGANSPFFSADSLSIGFFADRKLKTIAVEGGAAVILCDAPEGHGGAWSEDEMIVFSPNGTAGTRLLRVSSAGGNAEPLTSLAEGEVIQLWPQVLPGGKAVLYTSSSVLSVYNDANLVVQPLPGGARKIVQRGGYHGRYLPSGHLVYIHAGTLFAAPFDLERLEVTGPAVPALDGVKSNSITGGAQYAVSATGTLVYLPGETTGAGIGIEWMDREGNTSPLRVTAASWYNLVFAPDGRRLAVEIRERSSDIWVYEWARDALTRLTADPVRAGRPAWTPDSRRIVFASARADKATPNLYWQRVDGTGDAERLTDSKNGQQPGSWHPSGKYLAFTETAAQSKGDVMILPMEGDDASGWKPGKPFVFLRSPFVETEPMFSPDGRWLAYSSDESGRAELYVRPFPGPGGKWQISTGGAAIHAAWSRTKRELFYGVNGQIMVAAFTVEEGAFRAERPRLWSEGKYQTRGPNRMLDLHPDGERFALAPAGDTLSGTKLDKAVFIFNFFDELRRLAPATTR